MKIPSSEILGVSADKKKRILNEIFSSGGVFRDELADLCDVSYATANKVTTRLTELGIICTRKKTSPSGRVKEALCASERLAAITVLCTDTAIGITVRNFGHTQIFSDSQPINDSLPYEENLAAFITKNFSVLSDIISKYICGVALINKTEHSEAMLSSDLAHTPVSADLLISHDQLVSEYISKRYPNSIYADLGGRVRISAICGGTPLRSSTPIVLRTEELSDKEVISALCELLSSIFVVMLPDVIIFESDRFYVDDIFLSEARRNLLLSSKLGSKELPELVCASELDMYNEAALVAVTEHFKNKLSE